MGIFNIDEFEKQFGTDPIFYLKFTSRLEYAKDILNGIFYANSPAFFREKELETKERGQGDKNELKYVMPLFDLKFFDQATNEYQFALKQASGAIERKADADIPIICFVGIPLRKMKIVEQDDSHIALDFPFSDEEYAIINEKFGEYCVLLSASSLLTRLKELNALVPIEFKPVKYVESNSLEKATAHFNGTTDRFFYKDKDLDYQMEYRLVIFDKMPLDNKFHVTPFVDNGTASSEAKIMKSRDLKGIRLFINYK